MEREDFARQLSALRRGELRLTQEGSSLSRYAALWPTDQKQYISALEAGYRKTTGDLDKLQKVRAGAGGPTLGQLIKNQWSDEAALGYAFMACNAAGIRPDKTVVILEHMGEIMGRVEREDAAAVHRGLIEKGGSAHGG